MYKNPLTPEQECREVPAPLRMRYNEVLNAARAARLADAKAFPEAPIEEAKVLRFPSAGIVEKQMESKLVETAPVESVVPMDNNVADIAIARLRREAQLHAQSSEEGQRIVDAA